MEYICIVKVIFSWNGKAVCIINMEKIGQCCNRKRSSREGTINLTYACYLIRCNNLGKWIELLFVVDIFLNIWKFLIAA